MEYSEVTKLDTTDDLVLAIHSLEGTIRKQGQNIVKALTNQVMSRQRSKSVIGLEVLPEIAKHQKNTSKDHLVSECVLMWFFLYDTNYRFVICSLHR